MPITKVGLPENTKARLKQILFDDVLNVEGDVSQIQIIKQLAVLENKYFSLLWQEIKNILNQLELNQCMDMMTQWVNMELKHL